MILLHMHLLLPACLVLQLVKFIAEVKGNDYVCDFISSATLPLEYAPRYLVSNFQLSISKSNHVVSRTNNLIHNDHFHIQSFLKLQASHEEKNFTETS